MKLRLIVKVNMKFYRVGWDADWLFTNTSFFSMRVSGFMSKPDTGPAFACSHNAVDPTCHWMLYQEASMYSQSCPCSPVEEGQAGHSLCSGLQGSGSVWALGHLNPLHCTQRLPTVCPLSCGADGSWVNSLRKRPGCGLQGKQKGGRKRERLLQFCLFFFFYPRLQQDN